ncbi:hypothetical protein FHR70_003779 [Microvirga lupini]|uniref:Uncharacterized protein n=1 Tax=Microvirga lupini TaxID=420324 RepID=A0A7W4YZ52_9HYPH|nr:hypothetical protein [Microvirga lupini]MBB3020693.1 hypothetical protein [Microvirga lupini]
MPSLRSLPPLNDRLLYINEDGSRRGSVIEAAIDDRAHRLADWSARSYIEAQVDGEMQIYQGRVEIRDAGDTTVSDMLAAKADERLSRLAEAQDNEPVAYLIAAE